MVKNTARIALTPQNERQTPTAAAAATSKQTSRMTTPTSCPRVAPSELRIASSLSRRCNCPSIRPPAFAHAINNSRTTAQNITESDPRCSPTDASFKSFTSADQPLSVAGNCRPNSAWTPDSSACAAAALIPGFSRPTPPRNRASRICISPAESCAGIHRSIDAGANPSGITPTIV